ncbi:hypothetical protein Hanom_Chr12g01150791 [Helianthus anomalus]
MFTLQHLQQKLKIKRNKMVTFDTSSISIIILIMTGMGSFQAHAKPLSSKVACVGPMMHN